MSGVVDALDRLGESSHIDDVLAAIIEEMGGVKGFAKDIAADFRALDPGSPLRQRIAACLLTLLEKRSGIAPDEVDEMDLEALERSLANATDG